MITFARLPARLSVFRILSRHARAALAAGLGCLAAACSTMTMSEPTPSKSPEIGLYEIRTYTAAEGKAEALDARFRDHTISLFRKHGMTPIAFWHVATPAGQPKDNRLFYLMGYKDRTARDASWRAFAQDPEWQTVYAESQKNGSLTSKIENVFFSAADYSPTLNLASPAAPRHWELRTYTANPGKLEDIHNRFRNHTMRIFSRLGMTNYLYFRPAADQEIMTDKMVYILTYPSQAARTTMWQTFAQDPEWQKVSAESQINGQLLKSPGGVVSVQLTPTDYSPVK